jgi:hypothetical protein
MTIRSPPGAGVDINTCTGLWTCWLVVSRSYTGQTWDRPLPRQTERPPQAVGTARILKYTCCRGHISIKYPRSDSTGASTSMGRSKVGFLPLSRLNFAQFVAKRRALLTKKTWSLGGPVDWSFWILTPFRVKLAVRLCRACAIYMPAKAGFGGCYVSIITLDIHKNNIKSNRGVLQNHNISLLLLSYYYYH